MLSGYEIIAEKVYFPYPAPYTGRLNHAPAPQLLLMVFRPKSLAGQVMAADKTGKGPSK